MTKINVITFAVNPQEGASWGRGPSSATQNLVERARGLGYDVFWYLVLPQITKTLKDTLPDVGQDKIITGSDIDSGWMPRSCDKTLIYIDPAWSNKTKTQEKRDAAARRQRDLTISIPSPKTGITTGHEMAMREKKAYKDYPDILDGLDEIICFGPEAKILGLFDKLEGHELRPKARFIQHNTISSTDHPTWRPASEKARSSFVWQGRDSRWKGWIDWIDFRTRAKEHGIDIGLTFQGMTSSRGTMNELTTSMKPKIFKPELEVDVRRSTRRVLATEKDKTMVYGLYTKESSLLNEAGFVIYSTRFAGRFWPEYATIEALQAGTVLAVPSTYFEEGGVLAGMDPEAVGLLPLPCDRAAMMGAMKRKKLSDEDKTRLKAQEEEEWARFKRIFEMLRDDDEAYDSWRERAWETFIRDVDWDGKVRMIIEGGSEVENQDFRKTR